MAISKNMAASESGLFLSSGLLPATILIVDHDEISREILVRKLSGLGYACDCCEAGRQALDLLKSNRYDLVLADVLKLDSGGTGFLKESMAVCPDVAVILVTAVADIDDAVDSFKDGAYDWIVKPFSMEEMTISVARALEKRRLLMENRAYQRHLEEQVASRTSQLQEALKVLEHSYHSTLIALSKALDSRDRDSDGRFLRVTLYAKRIGCQLRMSDVELKVLEQGALLHDIGKIGIPDKLLKRYDGFTETELAVIQKHPAIGHRILSSIKFLEKAARIVWHHHGRFDGTGYPQHLRGEDIDLGARILAIADTLEYLTSNARQAEKMEFDQAILEIGKLAGTCLDPVLVEEFMHIPVREWKEICHQANPAARRTDFLQKAV